MKLEDFVAETMKQIISGVNSAHGSKVAKIADDKSGSDHIKNVDFLVNVAFETTEAKTIIVDFSSYQSTSRESITRLAFSVPIEFKAP